MTLRDPRLQTIRAAIYSDAVSEEDALCHQNIAADLCDFVAGAAGEWSHSPAGFMAASPELAPLFAGLADVLSDFLEGISSGHLQALYAARRAAQ